MSIFRTAAIAFAASLLTPACASAQEPRARTQTGEKVFTAEQARADFDALYAGLIEAHADLFAATPRSMLDQVHAEIRNGLDRPMTRLELSILFQTFTARARHSHARIDFPIEEYGAFRAAGGLAPPFGVSIRNGAVYIDGAQSAGLRNGDRLVSINGEPAALFLSRLARHLSAETPRFNHTLVELYFPGVFWLEYGAPETLQLELRRGEETIRLNLDPAEPGAPAEPAETPFSLAGREARLMESGVAYLRPGPFSNTEPGASPWDPTRFTAFIDAAFEDFIAAGADHLILDLRDNPGGDNAFSDPMIAWFADAPFSFASEFRVRVSPQTTASNQARLDEGGGEMSARYAALFAEAENGEMVQLDIDRTAPRAGARFQGEVHVLVNRYSFSNAVTVAALIQDYGFGTVYGETTADMATTYGAMEHFTLPETGIRVAYPKAHIIRPNGEADPHPLTPDTALDIPLLRGADDVVLDQLLRRLSGD